MRIMQKRTFLAWVALAGCAPKDATAPGTSIVAWDASKSSRPTIVTAKVGAHAQKDATITWTPVLGHAVVASVHVETAPVDYEEEGHHVSQTSPVAVSAKLVQNDYWKATGKCDGPNYQMPSTGPDGALVTPQGMILDCMINIEQGGSNEILSMRITGDGKVEPSASGKVEIK
jgi:hypothetical protein